jgi:spectinomycin phosphotransferase/16S rRNA (guanine(1405)-N(7))-methyltransferase
LPESTIADALEELWGFSADSLVYQPVGFGSHHWLATSTAGHQLFATVDDLAAKLHTAGDTADAAFGRLVAAFATAGALRADAGMSFVIAPVPAADRQLVTRLSERYSLVVHPYVAGEPAGEDGAFARDDDRRTVVDMLIQVHGARAGDARADDFVVPKLDALRAMIDQTGADWGPGPYAGPARELLLGHASDLSALIRAYDGLASHVAAHPERMVITHGEPHASNVITTSSGLVLVDWDTALLAPPERDLSHLAEDDKSVLHRYAAATGTTIDSQAMTLYRLWWDLSEIAGYLVLFRSAHENTADTRESWTNLEYYLRPAERWPTLVAANGVDRTAPDLGPARADPAQ